MKTAKLRRIPDFWQSLSFTGNETKMRNALINYLLEEGIKCELEDGWITFKYDDAKFHVILGSCGDFAECSIIYDSQDEDYEELSIEDKTFVADKVNIEMENHTTVFAFDSNCRINTSFYYTDKKMLLNLFCKHFTEITKSTDMFLDILSDKIDKNKKHKSRRIGFNVEPETDRNSEPKVAAKV